jgi:glycine cleavage system H protein
MFYKHFLEKMMNKLNKTPLALVLFTVLVTLFGSCSDAVNDNNPLGTDSSNPKDKNVIMSTIDLTVLYTENHEWVRVENDSIITVGISDVGQELIGEIGVIRENNPYPNNRPRVPKGDTTLSLESTAGYEYGIVAPVEGNLMSYNDNLDDHPTWVNDYPYGDGWLFKIINYESYQLVELMSPSEYSAYLVSLGL